VTDFVLSPAFQPFALACPGMATPYTPKRALSNLPRLPLARDRQRNKNAKAGDHHDRQE
jgi:hypothetical protein